MSESKYEGLKSIKKEMFPCIFELPQTVAFIILSAFQQNEAFSLSCGIVALETVFVKRDTQHSKGSFADN